MDSGYYRAYTLWAWGVPIPDLKLPNGFSKALQENVTAAMNYSKTDGGEGDILWSHGSYDFDPLDPAQSGDKSILPFMLNMAQTVYSDPGDYQEEMDTMGRRLSEAEVRRQLSEDEPRWTDHVVYEPAFPHLDVSGCNQAGWSYFIVWVGMETPNHWHRQEFYELMHEDRVSPIMAYPPPEEAGRRLEESFVGEACSDHLFIWSKKIHPAPSVNAAIYSQFPLPLHAHTFHPLLAAAAAAAAARRRDSGARLHGGGRQRRTPRICGHPVVRPAGPELLEHAAKVQRARAGIARPGLCGACGRSAKLARQMARAAGDLPEEARRSALQRTQAARDL